MKILLILMTSVLMQVSASTFAQKITLNEKQASLVSIFEKINKQSGVDFLVNIDLLAKAKPVSINVNNEELSVVLDKIFEDQPLEYTVKDRAVLVTKRRPPFSIAWLVAGLLLTCMVGWWIRKGSRYRGRR
ncbi:STN domain-containing protein [Pedobacter steynii]